MKNYLHGGMYGNNVLSYLLWSYESYLQRAGYSVEGFKITNQQIEHIAPRTPTDGSPLETGYELNEQGEYSEDFSSEYLNCLGNLMLISGSHNASIGNKPFADKLMSYRKPPILNQQAEIASFVKDSENPVWDCEAIDKRHNKIVDFAITEWSFR
ncbi:HNH endonuclease family protein [Providencia sp. PROV099]|uniref:HNH endonuclease family protein n=1 Tax=Providencia sp. PROV099 TaxID=2949815 RepID=UPI002349CADC|nr:HNH endonuclease family protein [Providencia sp. PROV099]WOB93938.1 HNH endonuclease family protein [Providencia sp. PROV099]